MPNQKRISSLSSQQSAVSFQQIAPIKSQRQIRRRLAWLVFGEQLVGLATNRLTASALLKRFGSTALSLSSARLWNSFLPSRMLKKSTSFVLASLSGSTYRSVCLASSLAAAALDGLFEHPASCSCTITIRKITVRFERQLSCPVVARLRLKGTSNSPRRPPSADRICSASAVPSPTRFAMQKRSPCYVPLLKKKE